MAYTSNYAKSMLRGGDEPKKEKRKQPKVTSTGGEVTGEKFKRKDAKAWKKEHGSEQSVRKIKKAGTKYTF